MTETSAYYIDFGTDRGIAEDVTGQLGKLQLGYRLTSSNKLVLGAEAVESLRRQPEDANGGISDDGDGVSCLWMYGYAYPLAPAGGPVA